MKLASAFLMLFLSLLGEPAFTTEYNHEKFSLDVPQGWVIIPIGVVNKRLREDGSPEGILQLSLTTSEKLQDYIDGNVVDRLPLVIVQDAPIGYLSESECRKSLEDLESEPDGFMSGEYGPSMRSRRLMFQFAVTGGGRGEETVEYTVKVICTISGVINVHSFNKADDDTFKSDVNQIFESFSVADHYQWKRKDSNVDRIVKAGKRGFQSALGLGLIGSIFSLVIYFSLRGRNRRKKSD